MKIQVIYEDNHLIAVFKQAGVLSQPTHKATAWRSQSDKTGDISIYDEVKKYLKDKYKKQGKVFLGLLHRLDRPVSGIILFAKTSKGASRISEQFRNKEIEKIYQAIIIGKPDKSRGVLINKIQKSKIKNQNYNVKFKSEESKVGDSVILYYEVLKSSDKYSLLKIRIDTGKFHQIRAQLSLARMPILGDKKYGSKEAFIDQNIALCATNLIFKSATGDKIVKLSVDLPQNWHNFIEF